ncbi:cell division protein SepF [Corynebacterium pygosceleis]|uniref:Cell division protein SepF n=1 Tax=Corynebacterium pygosceleis TaxID=2800406 RepID=A0A9Q4C867_9CORY|nr:cell division protein SepF [Corynebacterium pygosceleis]MCK7636655.1 cell division protein SepF [Corynebacterium pygosceleis]MCK7675229.1 cell division protein SepF [Corynebacterium pygosceleis]MCL0120556.1 cell division protein SepF [Corynebacterium pygosceleis]MCX7444107.1 cell division protein SepF [Corynebacterium pygosceleis]MCX7467408.1 cell division protein SepF [Corynebacterium pygosceleis]
MSSVKKFKEFFGLAPYEDGAHDAAYYRDDADYGDVAAGGPEDGYGPLSRGAGRSYGYGTARPGYEPQAYAPTIVPVRLVSFKQCTRIGEPFRAGDAVVIDLNSMDREEARRVIDFAAGLVFALRGEMRKLSPLTFALIPDDVEVSLAELEDAAGLR